MHAHTYIHPPTQTPQPHTKSYLLIVCRVVSTTQTLTLVQPVLMHTRTVVSLSSPLPPHRPDLIVVRFYCYYDFCAPFFLRRNALNIRRALWHKHILQFPLMLLQFPSESVLARGGGGRLASASTWAGCGVKLHTEMTVQRAGFILRLYSSCRMHEFRLITEQFALN